MRLVATLLVAVAGGLARAETVIDGGMAVGLPAALPTGLSTGLGVGLSRGDALAWGARLSWSTATEYTLAWTVRHDDVRLRVVGALQHRAGRGTLALRLGAGGTLVREDRTRDQGSRAGLEGAALESTSVALLPAADLEAAVTLRVAGAWGLAVSGGPSLELLDGALRAGWIAGVGVAWHD
jgi:hypothetical protein